MIPNVERRMRTELHGKAYCVRHVKIFLSTEHVRIFISTFRFTAENKANRHPNIHMPFGIGPRNCIGMRLALLELKMAVVEIMQKFKLIPSETTQSHVSVFEKRVGFSLMADTIFRVDSLFSVGAGGRMSNHCASFSMCVVSC